MSQEENTMQTDAPATPITHDVPTVQTAPAPAAPTQTQPPALTQEEYIQAQIAIEIATMRPEPWPVELKVGHPKPYNGDPAKAKQWITLVLMYITLNLSIYNTGPKQVIFALSFMTEGTAASFTHHICSRALEEDNNGRTEGFPGWTKFRAQFDRTFDHGDHQTIARAKLSSLKQTGSIQEYITNFREHMFASGITEDVALIGYFQNGIKHRLVIQIYSMENVPTTIEKWIEKALLFNSNWKHAQSIEKRDSNQGNYSFQQQSTPKDPNAMDIDGVTLSKEEKDAYYKQGKCFNCGRTGHCAAFCCTKTNNNSFKPRKWNNNYNKNGEGSKESKGVAIKALLEGLSHEEKGTALKEALGDEDF